MYLDVGNDVSATIDDIPRELVVVSFAGSLASWEKSRRHHHRKAQLLYTVSGTIYCDIDDSIWIVPQHCAVWIPGGLTHAAFGTGDIECLSLFVEPEANANLPSECCTMAVSDLLQQLLRRAEALPELYETESRDGRLVSVILDELADTPVDTIRLPVPADLRLKQLVALLLADPKNPATLAEWAAMIELSERSLSRVFMEQIGMSFGRWRRQLHVILAIQRLNAGSNVQAIALDLGYQSASSFVTMFRKVLGKPPGRYLLDRQRQV